MDKNKNKNKKKIMSTSSSSFDHIFGPRVSSSSSSQATGLFKSIFPPPSAVQLGRQVDFANQGGHAKYQSPNDDKGERSKKKEKKSYYNEEIEPPCNLSSSLYYGGQENYSSTTTTTTTKDNMEAKVIPKVHQEEIGGKGRSITSNLRAHLWKETTTCMVIPINMKDR